MTGLHARATSQYGKSTRTTSLRATSAVRATERRFRLGEGVLWDNRKNEVVWVDILEGAVFRGVLVGDALEIVHEQAVDAHAGAVALAEDGGYLVAASRGLIALEPDGTTHRGPDSFGERADVRWNDGSVDPWGRFIVGSLALRDPGEKESLVRVDALGRREVLRTGVTLSNGIGFAPDGSSIYHVDTLTGTVSSHSYGPGNFDPDEPWQVLIEAFDGSPDGLTVDTEGALWVAEYGAGRVRRYSSAGDVLETVLVGADKPTSVAFVGPGLDRLLITTANEEGADGDAGAIFLAQTDARGLETPYWTGSSARPYWGD